MILLRFGENFFYYSGWFAWVVFILTIAFLAREIKYQKSKPDEKRHPYPDEN